MPRVSGRSILISACVLAVAIPSVAVGAGEGRSFVLGERNPGGGAELTRESEIIASNGSYGTRQSNKRDGDGGGAIYGCRSNPGAEPCIRSNNLKGGRAFEFVSPGKEVGRIESTDATAAPFTTNAGGTATGLNADAVDGRDGASLAGTADFKFALVGENGTVQAGRGVTGPAEFRPGADAYVLTFDRDVSKCVAVTSPFGGNGAGKPNASIAPAQGAPTALVVDFPDNVGRQAFYIQVMC